MLHVHWETPVLSRNDEAKNCINYRFGLVTISCKLWFGQNLGGLSKFWLRGYCSGLNLRGWEGCVLKSASTAGTERWKQGSQLTSKFRLFKASVVTTKGKRMRFSYEWRLVRDGAVKRVSCSSINMVASAAPLTHNWQTIDIVLVNKKLK
jgi:hypothetical protein